MTYLSPYIQVDSGNNKSIVLSVACDRYICIDNGLVVCFDGGTQGYLLRFNSQDLTELKTSEPIAISKMKTLEA